MPTAFEVASAVLALAAAGAALELVLTAAATPRSLVLFFRVWMVLTVTG